MGPGGGTGLVSVEYTFTGESAHSAGAPWRGRSALDAVELMNIGWNFQREHMRLQQRSHYVVTDGGHQPNVVPPSATVWYFFRETSIPHIKAMWDAGNKMAEGAALMTNTKWTSRILGAAWPQHMNKPIAEAMYANIQKVGLPRWTEADQPFAKAVQKEIGSPNRTVWRPSSRRLGAPVTTRTSVAAVPTTSATCRGPCRRSRCAIPPNIPGLPGHNWVNAIAMATPVAHKGAVAGAKVQALNLLDLLTKPELVAAAWAYFTTCS